MYKAKPNGILTDKEAAIVGKFLDVNFPDKKYKVSEILRLAKNPRCPIHKFYDWDIKSAAEKYWKVQTRNLINSVIYVKVVKGKEEQMPKAVKISIGRQSGYYDSKIIAKSEDLFQEVMKSAIRELRAWEQRYNTLRKVKEFHSVFEAVEKVLKM